MSDSAWLEQPLIKNVRFSMIGMYRSKKSEAQQIRNLSCSKQFELCRRTQQPSLTFCLVGGSTYGLWLLFLLRDWGKWTEMTATQQGGFLRRYYKK
jgi:hypothetical protein